MSTGTGSATLRIPNIRRDQNGTYECQARNNPNERPVTTQTIVTVNFKPAIDESQSTINLKSWNGNIIRLRCIATGLPAPQISWYKPKHQQITTGVNIVPGGSEVTVLTTADQGDYGQYKCRASNILGSDEHVTNVTRLFPPGLNSVVLDELEASSATVKWTIPRNDGGSPVIGYLLEVSTKPPMMTVNTHAVITGLTADTQYTVKAYAKNIAGYGAASAVAFTTKTTGKPAIPKLIAALLQRKDTSLSVFLSWSKPDNNGGNLTRYTIYVKKVGQIPDWIKSDDVNDPNQLEYRITKNIVYGKTYMFMVTAWNKYGESVKDEGGAKILNTTADEATSTTAMENRNEEVSKYSSTILGVIIAILVLSLGFNLLLFLYIKRFRIFSKKKSQAQKRDEQQGDDGTYDSAIALRNNSSTSRMESKSSTSPEYEPIKSRPLNQLQNPTKPTCVYEIPCTFSEPRHYQELSETACAAQERTRPVYEEPLRKGVPRNDEINMYQPLGERNQSRPDYQTLHAKRNDSFI